MPKNVVGKKERWGVITNDMRMFCGQQVGTYCVCWCRKEHYVALLEQHLQFIDTLTTDDPRDIIFQQENARPHITNFTQEWLKEVAREHGLTIMDWPSNSLDMNPIENLWAHLKLALYRRSYPDTKYLSGSPATIRGILKRRLLEVWWAIGAELLNGLVESMPRRVHALLKMKRWYMDYWCREVHSIDH